MTFRRYSLIGRLVVMAAMLLTLAAHSLWAVTYVNRVFNPNPPGYSIVPVTLSSQAWNAAGSPYIIEAQVTVGAGATLTVTNATVQVSGNQVITCLGTIAASGSTFEGLSASRWTGLYLSPASGASTISGCTFSDAGAYNGGTGIGHYHGGYRFGTIFIDDCDPSITNTTINNSETHGIEVYSSNATIQSCNLNSNTNWFSVYMDNTSCFPVMSGNTGTGLGYAGVAVVGGNIDTNGTWDRGGTTFPYYVLGTITVNADKTLTIDPGVSLRMQPGIALHVVGALNTNGTAGQPVTFTSRNDTPQKGDWTGIAFYPSSGASSLTHTVVDYSGAYNGGSGIRHHHGSYHFGAVAVDSSSPTFTNLTVRNSQTNGLDLYDCDSSFTNTTLTVNDWSALYMRAGSAPVFSTLALNSNSPGGAANTISMDATCRPFYSSVTAAGNVRQGIEVVGGTMSADTTWQRLANNMPYVLSGNVTVAALARLTIDPSATVKLAGTGIYVLGNLTANSSTGRITFTSLNHDFEGDTNNDGGTTTPNAGQWLGIYLGPNATSSVVNRCDFKYGGSHNGGAGIGYYRSAYRFGFLFADAATPTITNCTFADTGTHGMEIWNAAATIQNNAFSGIPNSWYAIRYGALSTFPTMTGNTVSGSTGYRGIGVPGGTLGATATWNQPGPNFPYFMDSHLFVPDGLTLTIDTGNTVLSAGSKFHVNGTLRTMGTAGARVTFDSRNETKAKGDWLGIYLGSGSGASELRYTTIRNAGAWNGGGGLIYVHAGYRMASLYVDEINPVLDNISIDASQINGIEIYNGSPTLVSPSFNEVNYNALRLENNANPVVNNGVFTNNGDSNLAYTVSMGSNCSPVFNNPTFTDNTRQGIEDRGGTTTSDRGWFNFGAVPYVLSGDVTVAAGLTQTIAKDVVVKGGGGTAMYVNGELNVSGAGGRVLFTSLTDDVGGDTNGDAGDTSPNPGDWRGIYAFPSGTGTIDRADFRYGGAHNGGAGFGYFHSGYRFGTIYFDGCSMTLSNASVSDSQTHGVATFNAPTTITKTKLHNVGNGWYSISCDALGTFPSMSDNAATGTGELGVGVRNGTFDGSAVWEKPGANFPYLLNGDLTIPVGSTLVIAPGVVVKSPAGTGVYALGALSAAGSALQPVVFTARSVAPAPGSWSGIYLGPSSDGSVLYFVKVLYAGASNGGVGLGYYQSGYRLTALLAHSTTAALRNIVVAHSLNKGIQGLDADGQLRDSVVHDCGDWGVQLLNGSSMSVVNCTVAQNANGIHADSSSPVYSNTIAAFNTGVGIQHNGSGAPTLVKNCVHGNGTNYLNVTQGGSDFTSNPQFVDAASDNYHIWPSSPCRNAGDTASVLVGEKDMDGEPRVQTAVVDVGADEIPASGVSGTIVFNDWNAVVPTGVILEWREANTVNVVASYVVNPGVNGEFNIPAPLGTYDLSVNYGAYLRRTVEVNTNIQTSGVVLNLINGDTDDSNEIDDGDITNIILDFATVGGDAGFTDVNGDGSVDDADLTVVIINYALAGD